MDVEGVQDGEEYEVILTNAAGLYRYQIGDVIRILRRENGVPIFTFEYRAENCLRLIDVTVTEKLLEKAVEAFERQTGADVRDFCALVDKDGALTVLIEPFGDTQSLPETGERNRLMEEVLLQLCPAYKAARENGIVPAVKVRILEPETHLLYRDRRMFQEKMAPDQVKPIRILNTLENQKFFMALAED